jgi:hypothetical protein
MVITKENTVNEDDKIVNTVEEWSDFRDTEHGEIENNIADSRNNRFWWWEFWFSVREQTHEDCWFRRWYATAK